MKHQNFLLFPFFLVLTLLSTSCDLRGVIGFQPPGLPLTISVDSDGQVSFQLEAGVEIPTPLGTFSVGVVADPNSRFGVPSTLTIRLDGQDHFYDLHGEDFVIEFESAYYNQIKLSKIGSNLYLELVRKGQAPTSFYATFKFNDIGGVQSASNIQRVDFLLSIDDHATIRYDASANYTIQLTPGRHNWNIHSICIYKGDELEVGYLDGNGEFDLYSDTTFWVEPVFESTTKLFGTDRLVLKTGE